MGWLQRTISSSIGGKYIVSLTGLALVLFVVVHLSGNLLIFAGREAMTAYAQGLRAFPALLWVTRIGLLAAAVAHVYFAIKLNVHNRRARPQAYARKNYEKASWSSRQMVLTGLLLLAYVVYHLAHFTFRVTSDEIARFGTYDVYDMVIVGLSNPVGAGVYIISMILLGLHLAHGVSSLTQSLGINHPKYNSLLRRIGPVSGFLLAAGYSTIPLAVLLGLIER